MTNVDSTFSDEQYTNAYPPSMRYHYWSLARCSCVYRELKRQKADRLKVLEIGCGTGIVVANLRARGVDVDGCELAAIPKSLVLSEHVLAGVDAFELPRAEREGYGAILLLDVLEHLEDRADFLDKILAYFPNATSLILTVPARPELWTNFDDYFGHQLRYDLPKLKREIARSNWTLTAVSYFFHLIYFPMWILAKLAKRREVKLAGPSGLAKILHKFIAGFFSLEAMLLPGRVIGTSIIAHLKR